MEPWSVVAVVLGGFYSAWSSVLALLGIVTDTGMSCSILTRSWCFPTLEGLLALLSG